MIRNNKSVKLSELGQLSILLFYKLRENDMTTSRYGLNKSLFKLKMELGENHPLSSSINYYWYNHGPYSEELEKEFFSISNLYLEKSNRTQYRLDDKLYFKLQDNIESKLSLIFNDYSEVENIVDDIVSDRNRFYNLDKEIYEDYAPYSFMYPYKFKIVKWMENNNAYDLEKFEELINVFNDCESKLPFDDYFNDFEDSFSCFLTLIDKMITKDSVEDLYLNIHDNLIFLWYAFTPGLSYKNHDSVYEYKKELWDNHFKNKISELNNNLDNLANNINKKHFKSEFSGIESKFLNRTIKPYLGD